MERAARGGAGVHQVHDTVFQVGAAEEADQQGGVTGRRVGAEGAGEGEQALGVSLVGGHRSSGHGVAGQFAAATHAALQGDQRRVPADRQGEDLAGQVDGVVAAHHVGGLVQQGRAELVAADRQAFGDQDHGLEGADHGRRADVGRAADLRRGAAMGLGEGLQRRGNLIGQGGRARALQQASRGEAGDHQAHADDQGRQGEEGHQERRGVAGEAFDHAAQGLPFLREQAGATVRLRSRRSRSGSDAAGVATAAGAATMAGAEALKAKAGSRVAASRKPNQTRLRALGVRPAKRSDQGERADRGQRDLPGGVQQVCDEQVLHHWSSALSSRPTSWEARARSLPG